MEGFTKLFKGITRSTIWSLDNDHKVAWLFLLAEADENGNVICTLPGIAKAVDVTLEKAAAIIHCFMSPDPYSGSKEFEGRRIEQIDRGWRLLNHSKYRRLRSREEKLEYDRLFREKERLAEKVAKLEAEKANETKHVVEGRNRSSSVAKVVQAEAEAKAEEKGGGGDSAAAADASVDERSGRGDQDTHLAAIRSVRDKAIRSNPAITREEPDRDLAELRRELAARPEVTPERAAKIARLFFMRTGRDRRDTYWRDGRWSLHLFATQGLQACLDDARRGIKVGTDGWPVDPSDLQGLVNGLVPSPLPEFED